MNFLALNLALKEAKKEIVPEIFRHNFY